MIWRTGLPLAVRSAAIAAVLMVASLLEAQQSPAATTATTGNWAELAKLPDWGGIWLPDMSQQRESYLENRTPWKPEVAKAISAMIATKEAGDPYGLFLDCLPLGMPSWILGSHNAMEILYTPGRVTMLGELDGNRMRRIYTDGRPLPKDPELTYHGYSVGRWENKVFVVDTVGILPEVYLSPDGENIGVRSGGDMSIRERIYLSDPNTLRFDLEITAPHVLTEPWRTSRFYRRMRGPTAEIIESVCLQGNRNDQVDEKGKTKFVPVPRSELNRGKGGR